MEKEKNRRDEPITSLERVVMGFMDHIGDVVRREQETGRMILQGSGRFIKEGSEYLLPAIKGRLEAEALQSKAKVLHALHDDGLQLDFSQDEEGRSLTVKSRKPKKKRKAPDGQ